MLSLKQRLKAYIDRTIKDRLEAERNAKPEPFPVFSILAYRHGYARTKEQRLPVAADGSPLPWYTYPAIEFLNQFDASGLDVYEFGSGNSSLYWARKGARLWAVEHNPTWFEAMRLRSAQLAGIALRETREPYASSIRESDRCYDLIIIDGAWRNDCVEAALPCLKPGGMIILDNSDWYTDVADTLRRAGFLGFDFNGFGPINDYCWTTSIFVQGGSIFGDRIRNPAPIGGIEVTRGEDW